MPITKLSEVLQVLELQTDQDELKLTMAIKSKRKDLESIYSERCNVRCEIIEMLKGVKTI